MDYAEKLRLILKTEELTQNNLLILQGYLWQLSGIMSGAKDRQSKDC